MVRGKYISGEFHGTAKQVGGVFDVVRFAVGWLGLRCNYKVKIILFFTCYEHGIIYKSDSYKL